MVSISTHIWLNRASIRDLLRYPKTGSNCGSFYLTETPKDVRKNDAAIMPINYWLNYWPIQKCTLLFRSSCLRSYMETAPLLLPVRSACFFSHVLWECPLCSFFIITPGSSSCVCCDQHPDKELIMASRGSHKELIEECSEKFFRPVFYWWSMRMYSDEVPRYSAESQWPYGFQPPNRDCDDCHGHRQRRANFPIRSPVAVSQWLSYLLWGKGSSFESARLNSQGWAIAKKSQRCIAGIFLVSCKPTKGPVHRCWSDSSD